MSKRKDPKAKFSTGLHFVSKPPTKPIKTETVEEFLKRGGKIETITNEVAYGKTK